MHEVFGRVLPPGSAAYLFGSRTDLNTAGGDIDLLIHVPGIDFDPYLELICQQALMSWRTVNPNSSEGQPQWRGCCGAR
ncbi:MAG: hypothetical protein U5L03_02040 [Burkholderiaceae bacterium]|nr:hypothetical protein [Burkholderiaceae bacterium]